MNRLIDPILLVLKGVLVGFGAILPGVSGGALCVAFGMYNPIINLLSHPFKALKTDGVRLCFFVLGGLIGFVGLSGIASWLMGMNSNAVTCAFVGFILGTLPDLWRDAGAKGRKGSSIVAMIIGFLALLSLLLLFRHASGIEIAPGFPGYLFCGIMWGLSFVVPGLSSSTLLIFFGLYEPMLAGISSLSMSVLIPLAIGVALCLLLLPRLVNAAFARWHSVLSHALIGIVVASMVMVISIDFSSSVGNAVTCILCIVGGCAISLIVSWACAKIDRPEKA